MVASGDARLTQRLGALGQHAGATVEAGATTARIPELLEARHRDLLLVDADLPGLSPHDVCRAIRIDPRLQNLPVVFLSSLVGPAERLAAFQAGADDILPKSTPDDELRIRIRLLLDRARLREVRTRIDPLTGLLTREAFLEDLIGSLQQTARAKHPLTFAMIDINGLAAINRKHGFAGGDRVLASVGRQLRLAFMGDVLRGRWGDDEFVVAFPGEDSSTIGGVMQRVQDDIRQLRLTDARGTPFVATISVGLGCSPHDGTSAEELAMCAEQRLGEAKVRESEAQV